MPTYEYNCSNCGEFEHFHSISTVLTQCPKCGAPVRRLISRNNNIIFKGSGFHTTDYRSGDYQQKAAGDSSAKATAPTTASEAPKSATKAAAPSKSESKAS